MLDDLLGRTELKAEIADLEAEVEDLEAQLERAQERRSEAVTERQEAQRRANRLDDRIEQLEDTVRRLEADETTLSVRHETTLRGPRLDAVLDRLDSVEAGPEGALSAYVSDGHDLPQEVRSVLGERAALVSRAAPCLVVADDAGLVSACLRPSVAPDPFVEWRDSFRIEREWFQPRGRYTLALVRSDLFAMGTYQGDERVAFHGFDSDLKSQHSKGGFSQGRFERLRNEQIDEHLDRCLAALDERETDRLYVVGERSVLGGVMHLADATDAVDATGEPEDALADAAHEFWTVQLRVV
jgi:peptide subunit release factor 1 (eRF1)